MGEASFVPFEPRTRFVSHSRLGDQFGGPAYSRSPATLRPPSRWVIGVV